MLPGFTNRSARVSAVVAFALLALACGGTTPTASPSPTQSPSLPASTPTTAPTPSATQAPTPSPTPSPSPSPAAASLLLEITSEGGFIAPSARLGQVPAVVVDTAGNIYTADQSATPGLIQPVLVRNVGEQGAAQILAAMRAAGLDKEGDDGGVVADAGVTIFTATIDGEEIVNRVTQSAPGRPGGSPSPALALLGQLLDPAITWGAADVADAAFTPTAYKVYVAPTAAGSASTVAWPLTADLAEFGSPATPDFGVTGMRTGVVSGADAASLAAAMGSASADTLVTSNGNVYQVWIRPLLPPEIAQ